MRVVSFLRRRLPGVRSALLVACLGVALGGCGAPPEEGPRLTRDDVARYVEGTIAARGEPFDWNEADPAVACAAVRLDGGPVVVGARRGELELLQDDLAGLPGGAPPVLSRNERLDVLRVAVDGCSQLEAVRALPSVAFVDIPHGAMAGAFDAGFLAEEGSPDSTLGGVPNPGEFDPDGPISYTDFLEGSDSGDVKRMRIHRMDEVYEVLRQFGEPSIGVAIVDNGVFADQVDFLSTGRGLYRTDGYLEPDANPHPREDDFFGLAPTIPAAFDHGTRQSRHLQRFAPHADRMTVRAASLPFLVLPKDLAAVSRAIEALADDDEVDILSLSLGSVFRSREMERAIEYFHGRGKILVAAAGTSVPVVRTLVGVIFPASLPTTISATGGRRRADGGLGLGESSHGGRENDFVVEATGSSSEAVSTTAGMMAVLWAIDPTQSRDCILDAMTRSSAFYIERGRKHPWLGWGPVDMMQAAQRVSAGACTDAG